MSNRICVYGNFRLGQVNYIHMLNKFGRNGLYYRKTIQIPGFLMYENLYYPEIERSGNNDDLITVDLMDASDEAYNHIKKDANDSEFFEDTICIDDRLYSIFLPLFVKDEIKMYPLEDGNWSTSHTNFFKYLKV